MPELLRRSPPPARTNANDHEVTPPAVPVVDPGSRVPALHGIVSILLNAVVRVMWNNNSIPLDDTQWCDSRLDMLCIDAYP